MARSIYLPDAEQSKSMMEDAWHEFLKTAADAGYESLGCNDGWYKDLFMAGYCYGHNDCLGIIGGQIELDNTVFDKKS